MSSVAETVRPRPYVPMVLAGLALRLAWILIAHSYVIPLAEAHPPMSVADPHFLFGNEIGSIAHSIVTGRGFGSPFGAATGPTAWIAPVFPYLVAGVFKVFGLFSAASAFVLLFLNGCFSAVTCVPLFLICDRTVGRAAGLCTGWAWALFPYFMRWPATLIWETSLVALLLTLLVLMTLRLGAATDADTRGRHWFGYGALWAFALLTNPALLTFLPVAFLWLAGRRPRGAQPVWHPLLLALVTAAVLVTPWLARNRIALGRFVFIRSNFGFEFSLGNYHLSNGFGWGGRHPSVNQREREQYAELGEAAYVAAKREQALSFVRQYPYEFVDLTATRIQAFWSGAMMRYGGETLPVWAYAGLSLGSLFGLLLAARERISGTGLLFGLLLLYPLPYYLAFPQARNRYAIEPEMLTLSAYFLVSVAARLRLTIKGPRTGPLSKAIHPESSAGI